MGRSGTKKCKYMKEEKDDIDIDQKKAKKTSLGKSAKKSHIFLVLNYFSINLYIEKQSIFTKNSVKIKLSFYF